MYSWKSNLVGDVSGGLTVGIMHVPQGIAYAVLTGVDPVYGLYASFFPALVYMFFGTSRHVSVGSFAVVSLMAGIAVNQLLPNGDSRLYTPSPDETMMLLNGSLNYTLTSERQLLPIEVASVLTLTIGIVQLLMAVLRLEFVATYLSDQVVSGFTTGAAFHVLLAQLDDLVGLKVQRRNGIGYLFFQVYAIVSALPNANVATAIVSLCAIIFLFVCKEYINPLVAKKSPFPVPAELIVVTVGTAASHFLRLNEQYDVPIVSFIPTGLPMPSVPRLELIPDVLGDAVGIAIVVVAIHVSMAKLFAKKHGYKIDDSQELLAIGLTETLSSFFSVFPISTALARSMVNEGAGSKTLLSSAFSCTLLLFVILWIGPLLQTLPMCILASIIVVSLKGMFMKLHELKVLWPLSKIDFMIWLVSFVATVGYDVMPGLAISVIFALFTTVFRSQWPRWHFLKRLTGTSDYRDAARYASVSEFFGVRIFRYEAPLLFCNVDRFKKNVHKAAEIELRFNTGPYVASTVRAFHKQNSSNVAMDELAEDIVKKATLNSGFKALVKNIVIDCSGFTYVDYMGVSAIKEIYDEMNELGVKVYFAATKATVRDLFETSGFYELVPKSNFYPTISDAVVVAQNSLIAERDAVSNETIDTSTNICRIFVGPSSEQVNMHL
uniref:STAS domain-containing protein n=1 Tax=Plectus sambesii TaxID=2011161 RepID=A0A914VC92_9BILA